MNNYKKLIKLLYGLRHSAGEYPAPISSSLPALEYTLFLEPILSIIKTNIFIIMNVNYSFKKQTTAFTIMKSVT